MKKIHPDKRSIINGILIVAVVVTLILTNFVSLYRQARNNMVTRCENEVLTLATEVSYILLEGLDAVKMASYTTSSMLGEEGASEKILDYLTRESSVYVKAVDLDFTGLYGVFNGEYLDGIGWEPDKDYVPEERPWYTEAVKAKGDTALVPPYLDSQTGKMMLSISKLLSDGKSVVSLDISLDNIQSLVEQEVRKGTWNTVMVLDASGKVVAHSDAAELENNYGGLGNSLGEKIYTQIKKNGDGYHKLRYNGQKYYVFCSDIHNDWKLITVVDESRVVGSIRNIYIVLFISLAVFTGILLYMYLKIRQKQKQSEMLNDQLFAMANFYSMVRLIRLDDDTYCEIAEEEGTSDSSFGPVHKKAQYRLRAIMDTLTDVRYKKRIFDFIDLETIDKRLKNKTSVTTEFMDNHNNRCRCRITPVERKDDGHLKAVMWMLEIIEDKEG